MPKVMEGDEEADGAAKGKPFWKNPFNIGIMIAIAIIALGQLGLINMGEVSYRKTLVGGLGIIILMLFSKLTIHMWQNRSPKLVWENGYSTTTGDYEESGNWIMFRLGGLRAFGLNVEGRDGVLVAPMTSLTIIGRSIVLRVFTNVVSQEELPSAIRRKVREKDLKGPYYYATASVEQALKQLEDKTSEEGIQHPTVEYLTTEVFNANKYIAFLETFIKRHLGDVEDIAATMSRIYGKTERKSLTDKAKALGILQKDE